MKTRSLLALIFALVMTFSLVSCNGEAEETTAPVTEAPTEVPETTAETPATELHIVADGASEYTAQAVDEGEATETHC